MLRDSQTYFSDEKSNNEIKDNKEEENFVISSMASI